mmetsp:Transcript_32594/g.127846  ORF Transcript_32594/g.127846 Transcript_32594/m.127846 type:complete len:99 (-) Transcript_32594:1431-1727(-)
MSCIGRYVSKVGHPPSPPTGLIRRPRVIEQSQEGNLRRDNKDDKQSRAALLLVLSLYLGHLLADFQFKIFVVGNKLVCLNGDLIDCVLQLYRHKHNAK